MDYEDLMTFEKDDVGERSCYVCGTKIDVVLQDVVAGEDPDLGIPAFVTLPVCGRCSSAVGVVIALEDQIDSLSKGYVDLLEKNEELSAQNKELSVALAEGVLHVLTLISLGENLQQRVEQLEAFIAMQDEEADALFVENSSLLDQVEDLERRIEAGAGLNDVEFTVISSAAYED